MYLKVLFVTLPLVLQLRTTLTQRQWISPTTTAAEMWNPYTWYWPYAIAAAEGYRNYYQNAQQITNQLYQQAYATNAFWWTNRPEGGGVGGAVGGAAGQAGGAAGQAGGQVGPAGSQAGQMGGQGGQIGGQTGGQTGQAGSQAGQTGGQTGQTGGQAVPNMSKGGAGWN